MRIFDNHFHIDQGTRGYEIPVDRKNVIFNFFSQYEERKHEVEPQDTITLLFDYQHHLKYIQQLAREGRIQGLKVHSRLQKIKEEDYPDLFDAFQTMTVYQLPVILDAFYTGSEMAIQPNLNRFAEMISLFPETPFIIAHSGGIKVLEYFMHLRKLPNVYFDLSFSLSYLQHASVYQDFLTLMKFGDKQRILFGTDFPFINDKDQLEVCLDMAKKTHISDAELDNILYANAEKIFDTVKKELD
jgi:predicted TIM-barrel fold metal-dependent hydrolase